MIIFFGLAEEGANGQSNFDVVVNAKTGKQRKGKEQPTSTMIVQHINHITTRKGKRKSKAFEHSTNSHFPFIREGSNKEKE